MKLTPPSRSKSGALRASIGAGAALGALLLGQSQASAQAVNTGNCADLPNPIYGIGGSAGTPLIARVAAILKSAPEPQQISVVYQDPGACRAMDSLIGTTLLTGVAKHWIPDPADAKKVIERACSLPPAGVAAEWGAMAQLATTCTNTTTQTAYALPNTVGDYVSVNSGLSLIVKADSREQVISAEAIHQIYGKGASAAGIEPWINDANLASRTTSSAVGLLLAKATNIPLTRALAGPNDMSNGGVIAHVSTAPPSIADPDSTLGFVSLENAETSAARIAVRTLAYQHTGQLFGYYPNSTPDTFDKINIREGRYFLWNPHHFYAKTSSSGVISNPTLARFISYVTFADDLPGNKSFLDVSIENGNIPNCAMHVKRDDDVGPLASYQPEESCDCYFEASVAGAVPEGCTECEGNTDCPTEAPKCNHNFCEVQ